MKIRQLEAIKARHANYLDHGKTEQPDVRTAIRDALISATPPKLKPASQIIAAAKVATLESYRSDWALSLKLIFEIPETPAIAAWKKQEAERQKRVAGYRKIADPLIRKAELSDDADAEEIGEALAEAAVKFGLYA